MKVYFEPRDLWVGLYIAPNAFYFCPLPTLVFKWERSAAPEGGAP